MTLSNTIQGLQDVLKINDAELAKKLRLTKNALRILKDNATNEDYKRVKNALVYERVSLIKYLQ